MHHTRMAWHIQLVKYSVFHKNAISDLWITYNCRLDDILVNGIHALHLHLVSIVLVGHKHFRFDAFASVALRLLPYSASSIPAKSTFTDLTIRTHLVVMSLLSSFCFITYRAVFSYVAPLGFRTTPSRSPCSFDRAILATAKLLSVSEIWSKYDSLDTSSSSHQQQLYGLNLQPIYGLKSHPDSTKIVG